MAQIIRWLIRKQRPVFTSYQDRMVKDTLECLYLLSHRLTITDRIVIMLIQLCADNLEVKNSDRRSTGFKSIRKSTLNETKDA